MSLIKIINFPSIGDDRGSLVAMETIDKVPFVPTVNTAVSSVEPVMVITLPFTATSSTVNAVSVPKLVILDGAIGQFREEYLGRGTLAERQMQIARLMSHIKNISFYFRCAVVFTNQVQSDPSMMFGDPIKPIGGNVVAHASTYRLYFKKSGKKRKVDYRLTQKKTKYPVK